MAAIVDIVLLAVAYESVFVPVDLVAGDAWLAAERLPNRMRKAASKARLLG